MHGWVDEMIDQIAGYDGYDDLIDSRIDGRNATDE